MNRKNSLERLKLGKTEKEFQPKYSNSLSPHNMCVSHYIYICSARDCAFKNRVNSLLHFNRVGGGGGGGEQWPLKK